MEKRNEDLMLNLVNLWTFNTRDVEIEDVMIMFNSGLEGRMKGYFPVWNWQLEALPPGKKPVIPTAIDSLDRDPSSIFPRYGPRSFCHVTLSRLHDDCGSIECQGICEKYEIMIGVNSIENKSRMRNASNEELYKLCIEGSRSVRRARRRRRARKFGKVAIVGPLCKACITPRLMRFSFCSCFECCRHQSRFHISRIYLGIRRSRGHHGVDSRLHGRVTSGRTSGICCRDPYGGCRWQSGSPASFPGVTPLAANSRRGSNLSSVLPVPN